MTFLLAPENIVFGISIVLMLGIAVLEGAMALLGGGLSQVLDALLPDTLFSGPSVDTDLDVGGENALSQILGWLMIGRVPALILLVTWLCIFGLGGYTCQAMVQAVSGHLLPGIIAWVPAFLISLPLLRFCARGLSHLIPQDQSEVVSIDSLVGRVAVIVTGTAAPGTPAQARLKDQFGTTHYVMVEPDTDDLTFPTGTAVLLISRNGPWFRGILATNPYLTDPVG